MEKVVGISWQETFNSLLIPCAYANFYKEIIPTLNGISNQLFENQNNAYPNERLSFLAEAAGYAKKSS